MQPRHHRMNSYTPTDLDGLALVLATNAFFFLLRNLSLPCMFFSSPKLALPLCPFVICFQETSLAFWQQFASGLRSLLSQAITFQGITLLHFSWKSLFAYLCKFVSICSLCCVVLQHQFPQPPHLYFLPSSCWQIKPILVSISEAIPGSLSSS